MGEAWDEDSKAKPLKIPGMALPGLRDLRIQFVALIEFDTFFGPVVHLNEISTGSSYIKKLRDYQTVSEVYAGVARADVDILTTPEDVIGVFRYDHQDETDITSVLLISCIPDTDMEPIQIIGSRALLRSKADPDQLGRELSDSLREYQSAEAFYEREDSGQKIKILSKERIQKPLDLDFIQGFGMIDLESKIADFRYISQFLDGTDLNPIAILNFLDRQYNFLQPGQVTSFLYNSQPLCIIRIDERDIFLLAFVSSPNIRRINSLGHWLDLTGRTIEKSWRFANKQEVVEMVSLLNRSKDLNPPPEFITNYIQTIMSASKLQPLLVNLEAQGIYPPNYVSEKLWGMLSELDGNTSIVELGNEFDESIFDIIKFLEWGKYRHIIEYLSG